MSFPIAKSLYIHVPFCKAICSYCDFPKVLLKTGYEQGYMSALLFDLSLLKGRKFDTIYLGGGTPSALKAENLSKILGICRDFLSSSYEFTVEANPESLDEEKIRILVENKVNRVSIGLESANKGHLSFLGRESGLEEVRSAIEALKEAGIGNINIDLMYGFPNQSEEEILEDIEAILSLSPTHISTYSLILEPGTRLANLGVKEADEEFLAKAYSSINKRLKKAGYSRYEISNFAKPGFESKHNLAYWKDLPYVGLGPGAAGYEEGIRYRITPSLPHYIEGKRRIEEERIDLASDRTYYLLGALRLKEGVDLKEFSSLFSEDLLQSREEAIKKNLDLGNIEIASNRLFIKEEAMILADRITLDLL